MDKLGNPSNSACNYVVETMGKFVHLREIFGSSTKYLHILQLKPELIKLDRTIIAGIDTDPGQRALGMAMVSFAAGIGATLIAEGIETQTELATVTELGMDAAQGYLLGRPSVRPEEWSQWQNPPPCGGHAHVRQAWGLEADGKTGLPPGLA